MSITSFNALPGDPPPRARAPRVRAATAPEVGATFELKVLERVQNHLYRVSVGGAPRLVQSTRELTPGSRLLVQVTATGARMVLRSADVGLSGMVLQEVLDSSGVDMTLVTVARQHGVTLDQQQIEMVEQATQQADEPQAMATAGLFLGKLGLQLDATALQAVYEALVWPGAAPTCMAAAQCTSRDVEHLSTVLLKHFSADERAASAQGESPYDSNPPSKEVSLKNADLTPQHGDGRQARREQAQQFLNTSNGGGVGYQYGVLPLLIDDQLIELDLVCFKSATNAAPGGLRHLTMTFNSKALGRIEVSAEMVGAALVLNMRAASAAPSEALAAHAEEVRTLITRLGWRVDSLSYDHAHPLRAGNRVVQHVLRADTLDRLL